MTNGGIGLPDRISRTDVDGGEMAYIDRLYDVFQRDFIADQPVYNGNRVGLIDSWARDGKHDTFWHIITSDDDDGGRLYDRDRAERMPWIRPVIEAADDGNVPCYQQPARRGTRLHFPVLNGEEYLVVISDRGDYFILTTAFPIKYAWKRQQVLKRLREDPC